MPAIGQALFSASSAQPGGIAEAGWIAPGAGSVAVPVAPPPSALAQRIAERAGRGGVGRRARGGDGRGELGDRLHARERKAVAERVHVLCIG